MSSFRAPRTALLILVSAVAPAVTIPIPAQSSASASPSSPQASPPSAPPAGQSSITTNVDEVSLDLLVKTKGGKPVLNLQSSDLAVTDNGSPVKLSDLHLVTSETQSDHLVTLVFDRLDTAPAKAARELTAKMLRVFPAKGYTFAVIEMSGRLRLIQSWTANHDVVLKAAADATEPAAQAKSSDLTPAEKAVIAESQDDSLSTDFADRSRARLLIAGIEDSQRLMEDQHTYPSLTALQALAMSEKRISGRKFIIWFSQGLSANADTRDAIKSLAAQANRAGVTLVAVDTNAMNADMGNMMMAGSAMGAANPGGATASANAMLANGPSRGYTGPSAGTLEDVAQNMTSLEFGSDEETKSPLMALATQTDGVYFRAGAGTKGPLRELQQDLANYYEATYIPNIKDYNGAFRPIAVKPLRKGIVVKTRAGYFALPQENGSGVRPFEVPLLSILAQPQFPSGIAFQTGVLHLGHLPDGNSADLAVQVPVSQLQVHDDASTHLSALHVSLLALVKNEKGEVVQRFSDDISRHEAPDMLRAPDGQFITMQRHFSADPGTYTLETAVMDRFGNKSGAQRSTFTITPAVHGPALSDVALVRTIEPLHSDTASFEPMRYMNGRIIPDLTEELPENSRNLSVFFLVHPLPPSAGQPQLSMQIFRNGESLGKMPLELSQSDGLGAIPYLGTIGGHVFPPGNYKVEATLSQGGQIATSSAEFKVEGTIAASMASADTAFSASTGSADNAALRAADEKAATSDIASHGKFVITAATNPVPPPTAAQAHDMIEAARQRALAWGDTLPNFLCVEVTTHSVDPESDGDWRLKDTAVQIMRYLDHQESRSTLQVNGQRQAPDAEGKLSSLPSELDFAHSNGEFGGMFQLIFDPAAQTKFSWQESDILDGQPVQVFAYRVDLAHSSFTLTAGENARQIGVAFHGLIYLDTATHSVRRMTIDADNIPQSLFVHASSLSVDYSWVSINNHEYLMPIHGAVSLREGKHAAVLNEFEFRNYRRFGSQVRILSTAESKQLSTH
ncbi:MAG: VWA domain-containing protein [Acidobacteriaceae bacterium]